MLLAFTHLLEDKFKNDQIFGQEIFDLGTPCCA